VDQLRQIGQSAPAFLQRASRIIQLGIIENTLLLLVTQAAAMSPLTVAAAAQPGNLTARRRAGNAQGIIQKVCGSIALTNNGSLCPTLW